MTGGFMNAPPAPISYDALLFDLYGTLFNISFINDACRRITDHPADLGRLWRAKQVEYALVRTITNEFIDFDSITADALDFALAASHLRADAEQRRALMDSWKRLPLYPGTAPCLRRLSDEGVPIAILSNGSEASVRALLDHAGLADVVNEVFSSDAVGSFKPAPRIYELAHKHFATAPKRLLMVSSNGFDLAGAKSYGLSACFVNRAGTIVEPLGFEPDLTVVRIARLPDALVGRD